MASPERAPKNHAHIVREGNIMQFPGVPRELGKEPRLTPEAKNRARMQKEQEALIQSRVKDPIEGFQWRANYEIYLEPQEYRRITGLEPFSR